jgi:hypothetical protein
MSRKTLTDYAEAVDRGANEDCLCQLCEKAYTVGDGLDASPLCNDCAQEAAAFLPGLLHLARMAMIPERDGYDQYHKWHERLLQTAREAMRNPQAPKL